LLNHITTYDITTLLFGVSFLAGVAILLFAFAHRSEPKGIMTAGGSVAKRRFRFRPGTWVVWMFQIWAMYWTMLYRGLDAGVVRWRETKLDLLEENLECEAEWEEHK